MLQFSSSVYTSYKWLHVYFLNKDETHQDYLGAEVSSWNKINDKEQTELEHSWKLEEQNEYPLNECKFIEPVTC